MAKILAYTEHPDIIRRGGIISTIKNCCFVQSSHSYLLDVGGANLLPRILLPLCGPEELDAEVNFSWYGFLRIDLTELTIQDFESLPSECQLLDADKKRETDPRLRLILIETLILLCATLEGRKCLKENGVYRIVQVMHLTEPDEAVS